MASTYLTRSISSTGDRRKWTWSGWVKLSNPSSADRYLWSGYSPNPDWTGSFYNEVKISNNISISALVDISSGGYIVNYTKNKLNEVGTHEETGQRYHEFFDDPSWDGYEEGNSTEWGKGPFSHFLNNIQISEMTEYPKVEPGKRWKANLR